jgi:multimeric flavodoxin WrbA
MKVLGIIGSMRKGQNTERLVQTVISEMLRVDETIDSSLIYTSELTCNPCRVVCQKTNCSAHPFQCSIEDDVMHVLEEMKTADALVIGAPQYFRGPPAGFHAMIERMISMAYFFETAGHSTGTSPFAGKPCGLVAVAEYSTPQTILEYLHDFCLLLKMQPITLTSFPYIGIGGHGELETDDVFAPFERAIQLAAGMIKAVR